MTTGEGNTSVSRSTISEVQASYILDNFPDAAIFPPVQGSGADAAQFIYRTGHVLTRSEHLQDVLGVLNLSSSTAADVPALPRIGGVSNPVFGLARVELALDAQDTPFARTQTMFSALDAIEQRLGAGVAAPDHLLSVSATPPPPVILCPATEPDPVPGGAVPQPGISRSGYDGRGTLVAVVDEGLVEAETIGHPWLNGVTGPPDLQVTEGVSIERYGGHGTFIASVIRAMAPRADVRVARIFEKAGAAYESDVVAGLLSVLGWAPDVISLSAGTHTWKNGGLLSFRVFVDGPLHEHPGTVLVAAAGNDGANWRFSPADLEPVIGVGALGRSEDALAWFSNFGDWVKVFAPGEDLVHAFAHGKYTYQEQRIGQVATFEGMARWSGTSFSTPVVAGLIAARMSKTGETAREASDALLKFARAQALPDVGPVLRPGQGLSELGSAVSPSMALMSLEAARIGVICGVPACPEAVQAQVP